MLLLSICIAVFTAVLAQQPGTCPTIPAEINFNATAFAGIWFDQAHTPRHTGLELKCDLIKFNSPNSHKLNFNSFTYSSATKQIISVSGEADVPSTTAKLNLHIPSLQLNGDVEIISTDYVTFAVLWTCKAGTGVHSERALILTREKNPSSSLITAAQRVLENHKINTKDLSFSRQHKCHEYDLNASGLSNSLATATSMGSLLSVHGVPASSSTVAPLSTSSTSSTTASAISKAGSDVAKVANKAWHAITG